MCIRDRYRNWNWPDTTSPIHSSGIPVDAKPSRPPRVSRTRWGESCSRAVTVASYARARVVTVGGWSPRRAERESVLAVVGGAGGEHVVELDLVPFEGEPGPRHVEPPHPGGALTYLRDGVVPVVLQVLAPGGEGERVVAAQVLLVPHLQPGVLHLGDDPTR